MAFLKKFRAKDDAQETPEALFSKAQNHSYGKGAASKDARSAFTLMERAASMGYGKAINGLGVCHMAGIGTPVNAEMAVHYFVQASDLGEVGAWFNLANALLNGNGIAADPGRAVKLYERGSEANDTNAMFALALCCFNGTGTPRDGRRAVALLESVVAANSVLEAYAYLGTCCATGFGTAVNEERALELWNVGAGQEDGCALFELGDYWSRKGDEKLSTEHVPLFQSGKSAGAVAVR